LSMQWNGPAFIARLRTAADEGLTEVGKHFAGMVKRKLGRGHGGTRSAPGSPPNSQSGFLSQSVTSTKASGGVCYVMCGAMYAMALEFGAVIRPKNGKLLVIPISKYARDLMRESGNSARAAIDRYKEANAGSWQMIRTKRGGLLLTRTTSKAQGRGKKRTSVMSSEIDFLLTAKTTILPRPFIRPTVADAVASQECSEFFNRRFRKAMGL
jgi:hypothetical protein